jgi:hypothetical protein
MTQIHTTKTTKPILTIKDNSAKDEHDNVYCWWDIDRLAMQEEAGCAICEAEVDAGWHCLDGGEVYCDNCIIDIENVSEMVADLEFQVEHLALDRTALTDRNRELIEQAKKDNRDILYLNYKVENLKADKAKLMRLINDTIETYQHMELS